MLELILRKQVDAVWADVLGPLLGRGGICEHGCEPLISIKGGQCLW
jgi:hypothetical protein